MDFSLNHRPILPVENVVDWLNNRRGDDAPSYKYVCSTSLPGHNDLLVWDIYYNPEPHPEFGNKYAGLGHDFASPDTHVIICNADRVEDLTFDCVKNDHAEYEYSDSRHDYKQFKNGNMIDGGRSYTRCSGVVTTFKVRDGKFVYADD